MSLSTQRFTALDVFRGMTVCFMIIVNTPGNGATTFGPLLHAKWHGFTPTDLVFPSFLFAVGNAMSFVMPRYQALTQAQVLAKIFKTYFYYFFTGLPDVLVSVCALGRATLVFNPIETTRIFGVLQRIALAYGIARYLIYYLNWKRALVISVVGLFLYWVLLLLFGEPGPN